jgi:hypothetical protein
MHASCFSLATEKVREPQERCESYPPPTVTPLDFVDKPFDFVDIGRYLRGFPMLVRRFLHCKWATTIPQRRAPIRDHQLSVGRDSKKGKGMTEQQERIAEQRDEISAHVAKFKATQEKFDREREEYFVTTLENARHPRERRSA